jgi:hypothetical protein
MHVEGILPGQSDKGECELSTAFSRVSTGWQLDDSYQTAKGIGIRVPSIYIFVPLEIFNSAFSAPRRSRIAPQGTMARCGKKTAD